MPQVSIVTPSYNRAWSISSCIQSLQAQTFSDYEHIIVDGGSTDGTLEILRKEALLDSRIHYVSEPDLGIYDAVNKGMRLASSGIVSYLNTDDFYLPYTLQYVIDAFVRHTDKSLIYGHWLSWHLESAFLELQPVFRYTPTDLAVFAVLPQPSVFFKKIVYDQIGGFDLTYQLLSDNDFFSRVAISSGKIIHVDNYLSIQTIHSSNLLAGNQSAVTIAKEEGDRYRFIRRKEAVSMYPHIVWATKLTIATIKHVLLPIAWRVNLLIRMALITLPHTAEYRLRQLILSDIKINFVVFFRYLMAKSPRHRFVFCTAQNSDTIRLRGLVLPSTRPAQNSFPTDGK